MVTRIANGTIRRNRAEKYFLSISMFVGVTQWVAPTFFLQYRNNDKLTKNPDNTKKISTPKCPAVNKKFCGLSG